MNRLMENIMAEYNLFKAETIKNCKDIKQLNETNSIDYQMQYKITNPYMIINQDH
jgi:hypothetical protein